MKPTALVTGAARGIGLASAKTLLSRGWRVALLDIDGPELSKAVTALDDADAHAIEADVSSEEQMARVAADLGDDFSALHALVNNAGVADFGPIADTTFARWRRVMATNLDGPFLATQALLPRLKAGGATGGGAIVNVASISGLRASTLRVAYGTSKAGVIQLTLQQAAELGAFGIRANAVAPGPVDTKLALAVHTPEIRAAYHDAIPLNRYGSEQEIANAICFLCSQEASYITGQVLAADGGFDGTGIGLPALRN